MRYLATNFPHRKTSHDIHTVLQTNSRSKHNQNPFYVLSLDCQFKMSYHPQKAHDQAYYPHNGAQPMMVMQVQPVGSQQSNISHDGHGHEHKHKHGDREWENGMCSCFSPCGTCKFCENFSCRAGCRYPQQSLVITISKYHTWKN